MHRFRKARIHRHPTHADARARHRLGSTVNTRLRMVAVTMLTALTTPLGGCAIGMPVPKVPAEAVAADDVVVLVLTRVVIDSAQRSEFDRQNSRVMASMAEQPGLLGYAARKQLFGNQGWTMSVWENDDARAAFVRSTTHREAIARSLPALQAVELKRLEVPRKDLPADWDAVLRLLADPQGRRSYWE
jgi:heme-degrading monooxygenase HmoA